MKTESRLVIDLQYKEQVEKIMETRQFHYEDNYQQLLDHDIHPFDAMKFAIEEVAVYMEEEISSLRDELSEYDLQEVIIKGSAISIDLFGFDPEDYNAKDDADVDYVTSKIVEIFECKTEESIKDMQDAITENEKRHIADRKKMFGLK